MDVNVSAVDRWSIIPYEKRYRDDLIFMVLEAKDALGRLPRLNEDLLDVERAYFALGDPFWLAVNAQDRVVGCIGYHCISGTHAVKLQRLYVKASMKRNGIGTFLLAAAERSLQAAGKCTAWVHLGGQEYFESYHFYPKHGYVQCGERMMKKDFATNGCARDF